MHPNKRNKGIDRHYKKRILCADDYGLTPEINAAILALIKMKRLNAVSCMTTFSLSSFSELTPYRQNIDIGLHFNLTEGAALTGISSSTNKAGNFFSINSLLFQIAFRQINQNDVVRELNAQLDQFESVFGFLPDFIDGHQHVHHLPIIRDALLQVYSQRLKAVCPYIRSVYIPYRKMLQSLNVKIGIIQLTGAHKLLEKLKHANIPHNQSFAGFYNFDSKINYRLLFQKFLKEIGENGLIMCHPGFANSSDAIAAARENEYRYFASDAFLEDWQQSKNFN